MTSPDRSNNEESDSSPRREHIPIPKSRAHESAEGGGPSSPSPQLSRVSDPASATAASPASPRRPEHQPAPPHAESSNSASNMPQYTSRDVGDPSQIKKNKQTMADLKLRRLTELNNRLREDLERERIPVSQASKSLIAYCNSTRDYMVPSVWGPVPKGEDPYAPPTNGGCCVVM